MECRKTCGPPNSSLHRLDWFVAVWLQWKSWQVVPESYLPLERQFAKSLFFSLEALEAFDLGASSLSRRRSQENCSRLADNKSPCTRWARWAAMAAMELWINLFPRFRSPHKRICTCGNGQEVAKAKALNWTCFGCWLNALQLPVNFDIVSGHWMVEGPDHFQEETNVPSHYRPRASKWNES